MAAVAMAPLAKLCNHTRPMDDVAQCAVYDVEDAYACQGLSPTITGRTSGQATVTVVCISVGRCMSTCTVCGSRIARPTLCDIYPVATL